MKRVSVLREQTAPERTALLAQIHRRAGRKPRSTRAACFREHLLPQLAAHGIHLRQWDELTPAQREEVERYFDSEVSAALTPLVFDPAQPFPFLSNLSVSLAFSLRSGARDNLLRAREGTSGAEAMDLAPGGRARRAEGFRAAARGDPRQRVHKLYDGMTMRKSHWCWWMRNGTDILAKLLLDANRNGFF